MKTARLFVLVLIATCLTVAGDGASSEGAKYQTWNQAAAAHYLDSRQIWWQGWDVSQRDHNTVCVSCHTVLPYALSRSSLRGPLGEQALAGPEHIMLNYVVRRVTLGNQVGPYYPNGPDGPTKTPESRGTEAVLNALILANYDAQTGHLTEITRQAFDAAWALQIKSGEQAGAWDWLNFHLTPWESNESQYYGAALAAIAVGKAPDGYRDDPKIQGNLSLLRSYLRREYAPQPLIDKVYLLWASAGLPGLLNEDERSALVATILSKQQPDGGWSLPTWAHGSVSIRHLWRPGAMVMPPASLFWRWSNQAWRGPSQRGLVWLAQNQNHEEGKWPAWSLNLKRDPKSDIGHFMSDAATGFAVLALENSH